jgi:hypothetical protein
MFGARNFLIPIPLFRFWQDIQPSPRRPGMNCLPSRTYARPNQTAASV